MHVVFDGRYAQDRFPGIGRYVRGLLQALPGAGVGRVTVPFQPEAPSGRWPWRELPEGIRRVPVAAGPFSLAEQLSLPRLARRSGADLWHSPHLAFPYLSPLPCVLTLFDLTPLEHAAELRGPRVRLGYRLYLRMALRRARHVLCPSQATRRALERRFGLNGRISVTPLGVHTAFRPGVGRPPQGLEPGYLLYVGTNRPHKNVGALVERYLELEPGPPLVLAGPTEPRHPWSASIPDGRHPRVVVLGEVPESALPGLYAHAGGFATLSLGEGFGLPVLEAMACGVPVAAADRGALPELVGEAGLLVDPHDPAACRQALRALRERPRPDRRALERARAFSWKRCAQLTVQAYRRALAD